MGIVPAEGPEPPQEEILKALFRGGLSTSENVSDVSGRGVGLDVVHSNVDAMGGAIEIQTEKGRGTTFRITLPGALDDAANIPEND
ncbi:MAG: ATP-binding protein [Deltaproteobacteria bacterium]|nr:ATP-binding protein [Deltaproteobacteria bacterium]